MAKSKRYGLFNRLSKNILHSRLKALEGGTITFIEGYQRQAFGADDSLAAEIRVHDPRLYRRSLWGAGSVSPKPSCWAGGPPKTSPPCCESSFET